MAKNKQIESSHKGDIIKWIFVVLLLIAGFVANYYFAAEPWPIIAAGWLVLGCIIIIVAVQTVRGKQFWKFVKDSRNEMRKVVWPSRQQTFQTTLLVIAIVIIFAIIMWGMDAVLMWAISLITG